MKMGSPWQTPFPDRERARDAYPVYQLGWFPDYPDAEDYLLPFVGPDNFLQNHFQGPGVDAQLVAEETEPDKDKRIALIEQLQRDLAYKFVPIVPLLSGRSVAVAGKGVQGVDSTLDLADEFRFSVLSK